MTDTGHRARDLEELKAFTRRTWETGYRKDFLERSLSYVEELLPREMALLETDPERQPDVGAIPGGRCDTLVLLVGLSIEPLLQAVCTYRPLEVVLVLNQSYGTLTPVIVRNVLELLFAWEYRTRAAPPRGEMNVPYERGLKHLLDLPHRARRDERPRREGIETAEQGMIVSLLGSVAGSAR